MGNQGNKFADIREFNTLGEKLAVFIEFKKKILRTKVLRIAAKGLLINIRKKTTLFVILSEAKNLILLLNFSPDVYY